MRRQPGGFVLFDIRHQTVYTFSRPVFLEPHTLRFRPRADGSQWLESFELSVVPHPDGLTDALDAEGNAVAIAWFSGLHHRLAVSARARVRTLRANPFDYLLDWPGASVPFTYPEPVKGLLASARRRDIARGDADPVHNFAEALWRESDDVLAFLDHLNRAIYEGFAITRRDNGVPLAPAATLGAREGACRDLSVLFIDACRAMGLAARFVSGYQEGDPGQTERDLHAWAEVYLSGAGWRGYDPTHGLVVSDRHVAVAAAADPHQAAAVSGTFRGTGVTATLVTEITIRAGESMNFPLQQQQQQQQQEKA